MHSQYKYTVKMVNVQEGQQHSTSSLHKQLHTCFHRMWLHIAQFHRVQMSTDDTDDTDVIRGLQMNTGKTGIMSLIHMDRNTPKTL